MLELHRIAAGVIDHRLYHRASGDRLLHKTNAMSFKPRGHLLNITDLRRRDWAGLIEKPRLVCPGNRIGVRFKHQVRAIWLIRRNNCEPANFAQHAVPFPLEAKCVRMERFRALS